MQLKKLSSETDPQIKFEDGSVKPNILIPCTGSTLAPFSCLKWPILKKSGKIPWTSYSIFVVCFRFRTVQGINGECRGVFNFLARHLLCRYIKAFLTTNVST